MMDTVAHQIIQLVNKFKFDSKPNNRIIEDRLLLILNEYKKELKKEILDELRKER
jgi:hypothetical protein